MKRRIILAVLTLAVLCVAVAVAGNLNSPQDKEKTSGTQKGWLGVAIQDITSQMEKAMELKSRDGALVSSVERKSPAQTAGIKEGDVIVQFGAKNIEDTNDLQKVVADTKPETKVAMVLYRKGEKKTLDVVVGKQSSKARVMTFTPGGRGSFSMLFDGQNAQGMTLRELNAQLGQYFGLTEGSGVLVWEVEEGSSTEKAGVKAGDVITLVGKKKIRNLRDVSRALGIYDEGEKAEVEVVRKGTRQTLSLDVEESNDTPGAAYWFGNEGAHGGQKMMLHREPFNIRVPHIELEGLEPDMDHLRIELDEMKEHIKEDASGIRERIMKEVRPLVRVRVRKQI